MGIFEMGWEKPSPIQVRSGSSDLTAQHKGIFVAKSVLNVTHLSRQAHVMEVCAPCHLPAS